MKKIFTVRLLMAATLTVCLAACGDDPDGPKGRKWVDEPVTQFFIVPDNCIAVPGPDTPDKLDVARTITLTGSTISMKTDPARYMELCREYGDTCYPEGMLLASDMRQAIAEPLVGIDFYAGEGWKVEEGTNVNEAVYLTTSSAYDIIRSGFADTYSMITWDKCRRHFLVSEWQPSYGILMNSVMFIGVRSSYLVYDDGASGCQGHTYRVVFHFPTRDLEKTLIYYHSIGTASAPTI